MSDSPVIELISYISNQERYVKLSELCDYFQVSRRTIFYRIQEANKLLKKYKIPQIKNERKTGYLLDSNSYDLLKNIQSQNKDFSIKLENDNQNQNKRIINIIWNLLTHDVISINELANKLEVSRNTIISDFKLVSKRYSNLILETTSNGHILKGTENNKRRFIFNELRTDPDGLIASYIDKLKYPLLDMNQINLDISELEKSTDSKFTENSKATLKRMLKFSIFRISLGNIILKADTDSENLNKMTKNVVDAVRIFLKKNGVSNKEESIFFSELILCSQVSFANYVKPEFYRQILDITNKIILHYDQIAGTKIKSKYFSKILSTHLYATYFRCKFNFEFSTPILSTIENQFPEMIKFVELACRPLSQLIGKPMAINEVALICLYFISYDDISDVESKQLIVASDDIKENLESEVLLVCTSGISTSAILYHTLHRQYPLINFSKSLSIDNLEKIMRMPHKAKLIITTASLNPDEFDIPVIHVQAVMNYGDSYKVEQILRHIFPKLSINRENSLDNIMNIINKYSTIKNPKQLRKDLFQYLYPPEYKNEYDDKVSLDKLMKMKNIMVLKDECNGEEGLNKIIKLLTDILESERIVTKKYYYDIVELIKKYGPYMFVSDDTFLAHAAPSEDTKKIGLSLCILKTPLKMDISGGVREVRCVILLSPGKNHQHDTALAQLINIVTNKKLYRKILNSKNSQQVYKDIKNNL